MPVQVQLLSEWEAAGVPGMLSVVIPAHNEQGHIEEVVRNLDSVLTEAEVLHEILVVNDNSQDRTEEILQSLHAALPNVRYVNNYPPNGFGFAVRLGLANFEGDAIAIVMADGSDDPHDLVAFYRKLQEGYDCVFGTRFSRDSRVVGYPWPKLLLNRLGNRLIQLLFFIPCNDITNAFKLYRRTVIAGLQPLLAHHFNLTVELPLKAIVRGYSYAVVPNSWYNRQSGISKFKIREMGSRYIFIILYCYFEKHLSGADYSKRNSDERRHQLQVWPR